MWTKLGGVMAVIVGSVYAVAMKLRHASHTESAYFGFVVPNAHWIPKGALAVTVGQTIYVRDWPPAPGLILHEATHVEQFRRWGFLGFYWRYGQDLVANGYENSYIEREARATEVGC
jgi:hypothetical protein